MHLLDFQPLRFNWFQRKSLVVLGIDLWPAIGYVGWCKEVSDNERACRAGRRDNQLIDKFCVSETECRELYMNGFRDAMRLIMAVGL